MFNPPDRGLFSFLAVWVCFSVLIQNSWLFIKAKLAMRTFIILRCLEECCPKILFSYFLMIITNNK